MGILKVLVLVWVAGTSKRASLVGCSPLVLSFRSSSSGGVIMFRLVHLLASVTPFSLLVARLIPNLSSPLHAWPHRSGFSVSISALLYSYPIRLDSTILILFRFDSNHIPIHERLFIHSAVAL